MADFDAPTGPPPPEVPPGWTARWNDQYKAWFYVNLHTKKSQWDKPTEPALPPQDNIPEGPPPGYAPRPGDGPAPSDHKVNPYTSQQQDSSYNNPGASSSPAPYQSSASAPPPQDGQRGNNFPDQLPPRPAQQSKGSSFMGKLAGKLKGSGGSGYPQQHYQQGPPHGGGYPGGYGGPQPGYGGGYPQQQAYGGYPPQQGYGGYPPQQGYGGYPPQHGYPPQGYGGYQQAGRRPGGGGGGMGMAGGMMLGAGAGMLGGAMLANSFDDDEQEAYQDGYQDGMDDGGGGDE